MRRLGGLWGGSTAYRHGSHRVYECHYHFVFIPKYHEPILRGEVALAVRDLVREVCKAHDIEILQGKRVRQLVLGEAAIFSLGHDIELRWKAVPRGAFQAQAGPLDLAAELCHTLRMTVRINARLDAQLARKVQALCQRTGRSTTEIVKESLESYYQTVTRSSPAAALAPLVGCAAGPLDLSETYKDHLTQSLARKSGG